MEEIIELCALCTSEEGHMDFVLGSVLTFMLQRTAQVALPRMSALERGSLTLRLISAGGLQNETCRHFVFEKLCPPYNAALLLRLSHELYLRPTERMTAFSRPNSSESPTRLKHSLPLFSLVRGAKDASRSQPPVDFRSTDVSELLSALLDSWNPAHPTSLSLGELPPGLATFLAFQYPLRILVMLQKDVVEPFVPASWRNTWHQLCFEGSGRGSVDSLHNLLVGGMCEGFWPALRRVLVNPLLGGEKGLKEKEGDGDQFDVLEGTTVLALHAVFRLWLGELRQMWSALGGGVVVSESGGHSAQNPSFCDTLAGGLLLLEQDGGLEGCETVALCAPHALLLVLYDGYCLASQVVRHALDHPNVALLGPSFADLESDGGPLLGELGVKSGSAFFAALALRLPVSQLYIAGRVWQLLETIVSNKARGKENDEHVAVLRSRLQAMLSSFVYSNLKLGTTRSSELSVGGATPVTQSPSSAAGLRADETPRATLRLKRLRVTEPSSQPGTTTGGDGGGGLNASHAVPGGQDIASAVPLLCETLIEFALSELSQPVIPAQHHSSAAAVRASGNEESLGGTRLVLLTPPHIKGVLNLLSPTSSQLPSFCLTPVCDVSCVLMSVLLYRRCATLHQWLLNEKRAEVRATVATRLTRRTRQWGRFLAPLGLFRYVPVADVLLPQCLQAMEGKSTSMATDLMPATDAAVVEFCGAVRVCIVQHTR
ncbi:hypothetical protein, conserved [Trypanosoma brucei brucei TREU927]|uniref:Uncharacterized protein n=2 Tax=Trypanosoma brucei TaxID=5691 RepID=Q385B1_TRYB2|nr:hypothetical protein, conserved [Trypanosoma brucei brucei TREU927]EAN79620.1 hypothetical protein, conserved [Trypanosoma brucei brucei TREU927]